MFPTSQLLNLSIQSLDHAPLLLDTLPVRNSHHRPCGFEVFWMRYTGCENIIKSIWQNSVASSLMFKVVSKCSQLVHRLRHWSKFSIGTLRKEIEFMDAQMT